MNPPLPVRIVSSAARAIAEAAEWWADVVADRDKWSPLLGQENLAGYEKSLNRFAKPYRLYGADEIVATGYPPRGISAAAGLLSTVVDMARFDAAIDLHRFLKNETQQRASTPFVSNSGKTLPHGLGWFSENFHGSRLIWLTVIGPIPFRRLT